MEPEECVTIGRTPPRAENCIADKDPGQFNPQQNSSFSQQLNMQALSMCNVDIFATRLNT